jgi:hypothetical protein
MELENTLTKDFVLGFALPGEVLKNLPIVLGYIPKSQTMDKSDIITFNQIEDKDKKYIQILRETKDNSIIISMPSSKNLEVPTINTTLSEFKDQIKLLNPNKNSSYGFWFYKSEYLRIMKLGSTEHCAVRLEKSQITKGISQDVKSTNYIPVNDVLATNEVIFNSHIYVDKSDLKYNQAYLGFYESKLVESMSTDAKLLVLSEVHDPLNKIDRNKVEYAGFSMESIKTLEKVLKKLKPERYVYSIDKERLAFNVYIGNVSIISKSQTRQCVKFRVVIPGNDFVAKFKFYEMSLKIPKQASTDKKLIMSFDFNKSTVKTDVCNSGCKLRTNLAKDVPLNLVDRDALKLMEEKVKTYTEESPHKIAFDYNLISRFVHKFNTASPDIEAYFYSRDKAFKIKSSHNNANFTRLIMPTI